MISTFIKRKLYKLLGKNPATMEMVSYWKKADGVSAKILHQDGRVVMKMEGEKYLFPGFPRGYLLFGKLSKLKHEIKNQIFNDTWRLLDEGADTELIATRIREKILPNIYALLEDQKFDIVPPNKLSPAVAEIHRAWTKVGRGLRLRDVLTHVANEDDSYRWRVMDMMEYFNPNAWWKRIYRFVFRKSYADSVIKDFEIALGILEHCEVIDDMKERQRLLKRVLLAILKDEDFKKCFVEFCREINWRKVFLTKADRYFMRGKYWKTDYRLFDY